MQKAIFQIEPLVCPGCGKKIENLLLNQKGIISVKIFPALGKIRTEFNEGKTNTKQLEALINGLGYEVEYIKIAEKEA